MSQVRPGILLGHGCYVLRGSFDPNAAPTGLFTEHSVKGIDSVSLGSLFLRTTGQAFLKTGPISVSAPSGTWQEIQLL